MFIYGIVVFILALFLLARKYYKLPDFAEIRNMIVEANISYLEIASKFSGLKKLIFNNRPIVVLIQPLNSSLRARGLSLKLKSGLVGTFHWAKTEDGKPIAYIGCKVKQGDVIGFIDALKVSNNVEAPSDGKITGFIIMDDSVVEYGQLICSIEEIK